MGKVIRSHGVRGALKVFPYTDDPERFSTLDQVFVGLDAEHVRRFEITAARVQTTSKGPQVILELKGLASREDSDALRQYEIFALETDLPLEEDEIFLHDLIGREVVDEKKTVVGTLKAIMPNPAHDIFVIARPGHPDALVPAVPEFVDVIDLDAGRIHLRLIEGLIE